MRRCTEARPAPSAPRPALAHTFHSRDDHPGRHGAWRESCAKWAAPGRGAGQEPAARKLTSPSSKRGDTDSERRVSPTRAARALGKAPWSWLYVIRRALPRKGETAARSAASGGSYFTTGISTVLISFVPIPAG